MKYHTIDEKGDYKDIGLHVFDYKLFEEDGGDGTIDLLDGCPYLKHIIQLWKCDWVKQIEKINEAVGMKNNITIVEGGKRLVRPFKGNISGNILVAFYQQLPMGRKDTSFGVRYQKVLVG